jgi:hypothetical protein
MALQAKGLRCRAWDVRPSNAARSPDPVKQRSRSHVEEAAQAGYWANGGNESVSPVPQHTEICPLLREEAVRAHS